MSQSSTNLLKSNEVLMPLARNYNPDKHLFKSVYIMEKIDGVAARFTYNPDTDSYEAWTRQNERIVSVQHLEDQLHDMFVAGRGISPDVFAELYIPTKPFKISSGAVRKGIQNTAIKGAIWDLDVPGSFHSRLSQIIEAIKFDDPKHLHTPSMISLRTSIGFLSDEAINEAYDTLREDSSAAVFEGVMLRDATGQYAGFNVDRSNNMLRFLKKPTADLIVESIEEAVDKHGNPKGMVGRINCRYKDTVIGVGPGRMDHKARKLYFENPHLIVGSIVQVQYKNDPTYDALREPTFQFIRDDKIEPNWE